MSKPPPFATRKKEEPTFDFFMQDFLLSVIDLHRSLGSIQEVEVPSSSSSAGTPGMIAFSSSYFYICTGTDSWRRMPLSTW